MKMLRHVLIRSCKREIFVDFTRKLHVYYISHQWGILPILLIQTQLNRCLNKKSRKSISLQSEGEGVDEGVSMILGCLMVITIQRCILSDEKKIFLAKKGIGFVI